MRNSSPAKVGAHPPPSSARAAPPAPGRDHKLEPDVMDCDMAPADLVFVLENLEFLRPNATAVVRIDRDVRDYLLRALHRHAARLIR